MPHTSKQRHVLMHLEQLVAGHKLFRYVSAWLSASDSNSDEEVVEEENRSSVETNELILSFLPVHSLCTSRSFYARYYPFIFNTRVYGSDTRVNSSRTYFGREEILLLEIPSGSCLWNNFALPSLPSILQTVF